MFSRHGSPHVACALACASLFLMLSPQLALVGEPPAAAPQLVVEERGALRTVSVEVRDPEGYAVRHALRETGAPVAAVASGWDPSQRAGFATWTEGGSAIWSAYTRDAGATWSSALALETELALRHGRVGWDRPLPTMPAKLALPFQGRLFLVQLKSLSLPEWRNAIAERGGEVLAFVPHHAHIVRIDPGKLPALAGLSVVQRIEPLHPGLRIESRLRDWVLDGGDAADTQRVRVVALEWGGAGKARIAEAGRQRGIEPSPFSNSGHVLEATVTREQVRWLAGHDDVLWIDRWAPAVNALDIVRKDTGASLIEEPPLGYCGQGVRGEVLDDGIHHTHPAFPPPLFHGPHDITWHGTNAYGIVFSTVSDGTHPSAKGLLPCAEQGIIADFKTLEQLGGPVDRFEHTAELKQAPYFASFQSNSWGNTASPVDYTSYSQEIDDIVWRLDIAITQAQGNFGPSKTGLDQAWGKNVISVGGIRHRDTLLPDDDFWCGAADCASLNLQQCVQFPECFVGTNEFGETFCGRIACASRGPADDGRVKPDVHGWFDAIYSTQCTRIQTCSGGPNHGQNCSSDGQCAGYHCVLQPYCKIPPVSTFGNFGGTSAATPAVAGALGILLQMWFENVWDTDPVGSTVFEAQPHFSTIKALLINNSKQYPFLGTSHEFTRGHQGWGRPNLALALDRAGRSFIVDEKFPLTVGQTRAFDVEVLPGESELKITLVYPDPPGTLVAGPARINNLDLVARAPNGVTYRGNFGLDTGPYSAPGGTANSVDTVENVFVQAPKPGLWRITVHAVEVNQDAHLATPTVDDVAFALVVTGAGPDPGL